MKKITLLLLVLAFLGTALAQQTSFQQTGQTFSNGESVWDVVQGQVKGEFWPIRGLNLVTRDHFPGLFQGSLPALQDSLRAVATAPDGMTSGSAGRYRLEGMSLATGRPCGDGTIPNFGIVLVDQAGFNIQFTHRLEHPGEQFQALYDQAKGSGGTLFFLPSIYRNGRFLSSQNKVDKVLIRRDTPGGPQIGVILFNALVTYDEARTIILGLDRPGLSSTTHIYVLDGGPTWGQAARKTNGVDHIVGTRDPNVVTNYLVFY